MLLLRAKLPFRTLLAPGFASRILGDEFGNEDVPRKNRFLNFAKKPQNVVDPPSRPKTLADMKKLQSFISEYKTTEGKSLNDTMKSYARRDEAFNEFMKEFKRKEEPKWANVFDFTEGSKEDILLNKSPDFRVDELKMLEEFRRRKKIKSYYKAITESEKKLGHYEETEPTNEAEIHEEMSKKERYLKLAEQYESVTGMEYFQPGEGEIFNPSDFTIMFMDSDAITKITSLNRINRRRVLLFCGNQDGVISYGKGRGIDYEDAFESAVRGLKENMIAIDLDHLNTLPKPIRGRYNDFKLELRPRDPPNHWGGGQLWLMFKMIGLFHHDWSCNVRKRKPYPLVYALFNLVTQNTTVKRLAEVHGKKHYQLYYGRPSRHNVPRGMRF